MSNKGPHSKAYPVTMFPNQGRGALWGATRLGKGGTLPEGYDFSLNMLVGRRYIVPSFAPVVNQGLASINPPAAVVPWKDTATPANPIALILYWNKVKLFKNGSITAETDATADNYGPGVLFDSAASSPADTLYAAVISGNTDINRRSQAGSWTETVGTDAKAVLRAGKDFYRVVNDYQIKKWTGSGNPYVNADYGSAYNVGHVGSVFRAACAIGDRSFWAKDDGKIYGFDRDQNAYVPVYEKAPDPDDFPFFASDGQGGQVTATADGAIVHISRFGDVTTHYPILGKSPGIDTPRGRFVAAQPFEGDIWLEMDRGYRFGQPPGMKVFYTQDNAATYIDASADVIDQRDDTVFDFSTMDTGVNGDWMLIGADQPFLAIDWRMIGLNTAAARVRVRYLVSDSSLTGVELTSVMHNGTDTAPETTPVPWGQSGIMAFGAGIQHQSWGKTSQTLNGVAYSKFWMMLYTE